VDSIFFLAGVILERAAITAGFLAATIAVGGFIARAFALLGARASTELERLTAFGGVLGLAFGILVILVDKVVG
jgi:uncharacterized membrane protein